MKTLSVAACVAATTLALGCGEDAPPEPQGQGGDAFGGSAGAPVGVGGAGGPGVGGAMGGAGGAGGVGGDPSCENSLDVDDDLPALLSETGLYTNIATLEVAPAARMFDPQFTLWTDAAEKTRWVYLPECDTIDTSDENDWSFPVGTRVWKEFRVGGERMETRLIERTGTGPNDFLFTAYIWNAAGTEATRTPEGADNVLGTQHDVPDELTCRLCHGGHALKGGRASRLLGPSALQLAHSGSGLTLQDLVDEGKLSTAPASMPALPADASPAAAAALGYLHANCGHCHNGTSDAVPQVDMNLWLDVDHATVAETPAYLTTINVANQLFNDQHVTARVVPGMPSESALYFRMGERGNPGQMPQVGTEVIDASGRTLVEAWITELMP